MKIMPTSLIAVLVTGLFLFTAVQFQTVMPAYAAALSPTSTTYLDSDADGTVDVIRIAFTDVTACTYEAGDWAVGVAGTINVSAVTGFANSGSCTTDEYIDVSVTADSGITGGVTDPRLDYTDAGTAGSVVADTNQDAANFTATDGAAPIISDFMYQDNNLDGYIDQIDVGFTETVTAASTLGANDLTFSNVGDFTGAVFGVGADTISGSVSSTTITLGTPATARDTKDDSGSLAIATQNAFSLTDGTNTNSTTGAQTQATYSDGAAPVFYSVQPQTSGYHNTETVDYTLTETATGGTVTWTRTGGTADGNSPHSCALQGTSLNSGAHNNLVLQTDANACTAWANSLVDGAVYTVTWQGGDGGPASPGPTTTSTGVTYDTTAPTPNVSVGTVPIYEGDLVQEVTVLYDESMDNTGADPTIAFGSSTHFTSNSDGAWSTTTNTNDTWTETFTHDGTGENILPDSVNVTAGSAATDLAGNSDNQDASAPTFGIDTIDPVPTITSSPTPTNGAQTISFTATDTGGTGVASTTCSVDGSTFTACTTGDAYSTLGGWGSIGDGAFTLTLRVTDTAGNTADDTAAVSKDTTVTITDGNISIAGASGTGGAYKIGDTVTVTWDAATDGNTDIASATANLSGFGGGAAVAMTDTTACGGTNADNVYEACYTIVAGAIDGTSINATVSAVDNLSNSAGPVSDSSNATVDNVAPVIGAAGTIALTDTSTEGVASIGENLTYADGTVGAADGDSWTVDLSAYGLSGTQAAGAVAVVADNDDGAFSATETLTDNAGNTATGSVTLTNFASIDNVAPVVTDGNISIAGASGTGGAYKIGDTVTVTWDAATDGTTDVGGVVANLSGFGGGGGVAMTDTTACGGTNGDNVWEACYTIVAGAIDGTNVNATVTATDDGGNSTGPVADTTNATVDNVAPIIGAAGTLTLTDSSGEGVASIGENLTYADGTVGAADGDSWTVDLSAYGLSGTQAAGAVAVVADNDDGAFSATETLTDNAGNTATGAVTLVGYTNIDNIAPTVTDGNISIAGASGTGGAYKIGDTVTVTWDAATDGSADAASAAANLSAFGGGAAVAMTDTTACGGTNGDNVWEACYTIVAGAIDGANLNATVTGTDDGGNPTGPVADTTNATVDSQAPVVTDGNISIAGGSGTGGAYIIGDTVTVTWDAQTDGTTDVASAAADLSGWGGSGTAAMTDTTACGGTNADNVWEACYTIVAGAVDGTNVNATVSPTDDAGNVTAPVADSSNATVDNIAPTIGTPGSLAITLDNNTNSVANISDTVTYTDAVPGAADGDTFTVDLTNLTGDAAATNAGSPYTVVQGTLTGTQTFTETVTDNAGNTATGSTAGLAVDNRSLLTTTNVEPASLVASASSTATVTFTTVTALPANGKIKVTFGAGFNVTGAANGDCTSMDGTFVTTVSGQQVILTRQNDGTAEPAGAQTCTIDTIVNPSATGSTGTYTIVTTTSADATIDIDDAVSADTITSAVVTTQCNDGLDNDGNGLIDYPNDPYCTSAGDTLEAYEGGGGGGGGGGGASTNPSSNSTTTTAAAPIQTLEGDQGYSSPVQFDEADITINEDDGTASADLTGPDGSLTLKPNSKSTISAYFPPNTTVTGPKTWNGKIEPPVTRSLTMITKSGEKIEGSDDKLMRDDVVAIIKIGATVPLSFSQEVTLEIPVDLPDGSVVQVYTSRDGNTWEATIVGTVVDGKLIITTDHFSYFAVVPSDQAVALAEKVAAQEGFTDIVGHWAESYINEIHDLGIVSGKTESTYAPNDYITRAELTKIATKAFGVEIDPDPSFTPFTDVPLTAWYAPYVVAAREAGIVQGVTDGVFSPDAPITRAAALKIILESAGFGETAAVSDFPDVPSDAWFNGYVSFASQNGVVSGYGDGTFGPANFVTRAEVAKMVIKVMTLPEVTEDAVATEEAVEDLVE